MNEFVGMYEQDATSLNDATGYESDGDYDDAVTLRQFIKVNFSKSGEVQGFEIRHKMAPLVYI